MPKHIFIPSTKPGHHWMLDTTKDSRGHVAGYAWEVRRHDYGFEFAVFQDRKAQVSTEAKRATPKAVRSALEAILAHLKDHELVAAEATLESAA